MANWHSGHRPRTFKTYVGNETQVKEVLDDLDSGDITQTWIINGESGAGKTTLAYLIARKVLGLKAKDDLSAHPDFEEINANEDGSKETINQLIKNATTFKPKRGDYRVVLIDEIHRASSAGMSTLLKSSESPPKHLIYIFATNEADKIPEVIKQRGKVVHLGSIKKADLVSVLTRIAEREDMEEYATEKIIDYIASQFVGKTRLAITTLKALKATALKTKGKIEVKELEAAVEEAVKNDYQIAGTILENLYNGDPAKACQTTSDVKDMHHAVNTLLDLNNFLIQRVAGVKTYANAVRLKLWNTVKTNKGLSITQVLKVQQSLFALKRSITSDPMLDNKQVLLYHVASAAVEMKKGN